MIVMKAAAGLGLLLATLTSAGPPAAAAARAPGVESASASLRVYVTPRFARAPALVRIHALVEPGADNRRLEFILESDEYYRSSVIDLSGAGEARLHSVEFRSVPAGTHDVRVVLSGSAGATRAIESDRVAVFE